MQGLGRHEVNSQEAVGNVRALCRDRQAGGEDAWHVKCQRHLSEASKQCNSCGSWCVQQGSERPPCAMRAALQMSRLLISTNVAPGVRVASVAATMPLLVRVLSAASAPPCTSVYEAGGVTTASFCTLTRHPGF